MANRYMQQFFFSLNHSPVFLEGNFVVGASGAVGTVKGSGIKSVTKLSTGTYGILLEDNYNRYLGGFAGFVAPPSGSPVADGSFVVGTSYEIVVVGTTNWHAVGVPASVTPLPGVSFVATAVGGAGTGTAVAVGVCNIVTTNVVGDPNLVVNSGGALIIQCVDNTLTVANPTSGSVCGFLIYLRNSSVKGKGE